MSAEHTLRIDLANLSEAEKEAVASLCAALCDPAMNHLRQQFSRGELALTLEDGMPTWVAPETSRSFAA